VVLQFEAGSRRRFFCDVTECVVVDVVEFDEFEDFEEFEEFEEFVDFGVSTVPLLDPLPSLDSEAVTVDIVVIPGIDCVDSVDSVDAESLDSAPRMASRSQSTSSSMAVGEGDFSSSPLPDSPGDSGSSVGILVQWAMVKSLGLKVRLGPNRGRQRMELEVVVELVRFDRV